MSTAAHRFGVICTAISILCTSLLSCIDKKESGNTVIFNDAADDSVSTHFDLGEIQEAGELIAITLSGPDTYYEYRGQGFGPQFLLAQRFAQEIGVSLRMEVAHDSAELIYYLRDGKADMVAFPLAKHDIDSLCKGANIEFQQLKNNWVVSSSAEDLSASFQNWFTPSLEERIQKECIALQTAPHSVRRNPRPVMLNAAKGQISQWDEILQQEAKYIGWDWRLLAAQCYQESAFDPQAESWAGARGLMQIMPATASLLGLDLQNICDPKLNINAAVRYINSLSKKFSDISDSRERISFILAAYNGGAGHIRDAMALCKKNNGNPHIWNDVKQWVLALESPRYYRQRDVQFGYMRGSETVDYVECINKRWQSYRESTHASSLSTTPQPAKRHTVDGEVQSQVVRPTINIE